MSTSRFRLLYWIERFCRSSDLLAELSDLLLGLLFLVQRGAVGALQRGLDRFHLDGELAINLLDLVLDLDHHRVSWLERLQFFLIVCDQRIALHAQSADRGAAQELRQIDRVGVFDLLPELLVFDALGDERRQRGIRGRQIVLGDRRFLVDDDDLLPFGEVEQRLFRFLQPELQLLRLVLKEGFGVRIRFKPLVDARGNEGRGVGVGDLLRARWHRIVVGNIHQPRAGDRADDDISYDKTCRGAFRRTLITGFAAFLRGSKEPPHKAKNRETSRL